MTPSKSAPAQRRGFSYRGLVIALLLMVAAPALAWALWPSLAGKSSENTAMLYTVERGEFVHEIVDRGTVESANNTEVKCEVKSKNLSGTQILWVVPEGKMVEPNEKLVELDKSALENEENAQLIAYYKSEAEVIQAKAALDAALIALKEYDPVAYRDYIQKHGLPDVDSEGRSDPAKIAATGAQQSPQQSPAAGGANGTVLDTGPATAHGPTAPLGEPPVDEGGAYRQQELTIRNEIAVAQENRNRAKNYYESSYGLFKKGYLNKLQLEGDAFALLKAENDLEIANTKLQVLEKYTRAKELRRLQCEIESAQAKLKAAEASHKVNQALLESIRTQISLCTIRAPCAGQVVYANVTGYRGNKEVLIAPGEMARERQVLIRLPDPTQMQVLARISEAKIAMVVPGMTAKIRLDAFPDLQLEGTVIKVDEFPAPSGWFGSIVKEYETTVWIHDTPPGLRPGLTAEVRILIERLPDVLQVPVQAVFEHLGEFYCLVPDGRQFRAVPVSLGSTNDKYVVVNSGLEEGQQIVLNASAYRDKAIGLPEPGSENWRPASRSGGLRERGAGRGPRRLDDDNGIRRGPSPLEIARQLIQQFDANRDNRLDLEEAPEPWKSHFEQCDINNDAKLDVAELIRAIARGHGRSAEPSPPPSVANQPTP